MVIDKVGIGIILMIIVFGGSAALLIMGTVPEIFRQGEQLDLAVYQQHEDSARANQSLHEDLARDLQEQRIANHIDLQLDELQDNVTQFIADSEKRSNISFVQRAGLIENISKVLGLLETRGIDHQIQSEQMNNLANSINNSLAVYGKNSIDKFSQLLDTHNQLIELLKNGSR